MSILIRRQHLSGKRAIEADVRCKPRKRFMVAGVLTLRKVGLKKRCFQIALQPKPSCPEQQAVRVECVVEMRALFQIEVKTDLDRKSTRLNSSHTVISYAV